MHRLANILFNLATILSLNIFATAAIIAWQSHFHPNSWSTYLNFGHRTISGCNGTISLQWHQDASWGNWPFFPDDSKTVAGFTFERDKGIYVPGWTVAVAALVIPGCWLLQTSRQIRKRTRETPGVCTQCGYDLRATPDRCPECGTDPTIRT